MRTQAPVRMGKTNATRKLIACDTVTSFIIPLPTDKWFWRGVWYASNFSGDFYEMKECFNQDTEASIADRNSVKTSLKTKTRPGRTFHPSWRPIFLFCFVLLCGEHLERAFHTAAVNPRMLFYRAQWMKTNNTQNDDFESWPLGSELRDSGKQPK